MKKSMALFYEAVVITMWAIGAFLISISSISTAVYWQLAFRKIYVPIFYMGWVALGICLMAFVYKRDERSIKTFTFGAIALNLLALTPQLINIDSIRINMSSAYLIYIYAAIYALTLFLSLWAARHLFEKKMDMFLPGLPLALAPFMCLAFSIYQKSAVGIAIFGISIISLTAVAFFWGRFKEFIRLVREALLRVGRNDTAVAWVIFSAALVARIAFSFVVITKTGSRFILASDDGMSYDEVARAICATPWNMIEILVKQPWPPVYMIFLGAVYKLLGQSFYIASAFQSIFGAGIAVLVYAIGKRIFNKTTAIIAGVLVVFSQPLIFVSSVLGTEAVYIPLVILAIYLFLKDRLVMSGLVFGLASMTIGSIMLFPIPVFVFILFSGSVKKQFLGRLGRALIFILAFLAMYTAIKSVYIFSDKSLQSGYETAGVALWSSPSAYGYERDPDNREFIALGIDPVSRPGESIMISLRNWRKILDIGYRIFPIRLRNYFLWNNFGFFDPIFLVNPGKIANTFASTMEFYGVLLFLIGISASFIKSDNKRDIIFILLYIGYYAFTHSIMIISHTNRYSCPIKPFSILFLAYGMCLGYRYLFGGKKA